MRISSQQFYQQSVNGILTRQADAAKSQQQLATGKRVLQASDDPAAAARTQGLTRDVSNLKQLQFNAAQAKNRLQSEEVAITSSVSTVQSMRDLIIQARNGSNSPESLMAIASNIEQQLETLTQIANSQDGNGRFLFSGFRDNTRPFVKDPTTGVVSYVGDDQQRFLNIGLGRQVSDGDPGSQVFQRLKDADNAGATSDIFTFAKRVVDALRNPSPTIGTTLANSIVNMDETLARFSDVRTQIGSRLNAVDQQIDINDTVSLQFQENLSALQDVDYAQAITNYNQQLTGLQAAQQAYARVQGLSLFDYLK